MKRGQIILSCVIYVALGIGSYYLSLGMVRLYAKIFADAKPWRWEAAYVSQSPDARCYHYSDHCKGLSSTRYPIDIVTVSEAEDDMGREACKWCMEESRTHQYDKMAWYLLAPVFMLLFLSLVIVDKWRKKYKLRNPIVRKDG